MTPFDDFAYLINHVLLGDEPTIEDFILLVGTLVAFIAFILWCCFPIQPKVSVLMKFFKMLCCEVCSKLKMVHDPERESSGSVSWYFWFGLTANVDGTNHRQFSCKSLQNSLESAQVHSSYSKLAYNEYTMKSGGHVYHCCT